MEMEFQQVLSNKISIGNIYCIQKQITQEVIKMVKWKVFWDEIWNVLNHRKIAYCASTDYLENAEGFDEYSKVGHRHKKLCRLSK